MYTTYSQWIQRLHNFNMAMIHLVQAEEIAYPAFVEGSNAIVEAKEALEQDMRAELQFIQGTAFVEYGANDGWGFDLPEAIVDFAHVVKRAIDNDRDFVVTIQFEDDEQGDIVACGKATIKLLVGLANSNPEES